MGTMSEKHDTPTPPAAHADWFRKPTPREHRLGAGLFIGFGLFFILLFLVERDSKFRWVILGLGVISILRGLYHAFRARQSGVTSSETTSDTKTDTTSDTKR